MKKDREVNDREFEDEKFQMMFWAFRVGVSVYELKGLYTQLRVIIEHNDDSNIMEDLTDIKDELNIIIRQLEL